MSGSEHEMPEWYKPNDLVATVEAAYQTDDDMTADEIVPALIEHDFDAPRRRLESLIQETVRERIYSDDSDDDESAEEEIPSVEDPRPLVSRFVNVDDVEFLDSRDLATVLGVALSRYEGGFRTPEDEELGVDLFWNRQQTTVAFKTAPRPAGTAVDDDAIQHVIAHDTSPSSGREPSTVGIVSNVEFTEDARDLAGQYDIQLFGPGYLQRWLSDATLTHDVLGTVLEEDRSDDEIDELLAELPEIPTPARERDPLAEPANVQITITRHIDGGAEPDRHQTEEAPPGQRGELYANPAQDDASAVDRFVDELQEGNTQ